MREWTYRLIEPQLYNKDTMSYTNKELRAMAKERRIPLYYVMRKKEVCEALGIGYEPPKIRKTTSVTIRDVVNDETTHFPSLGELARAMEKNVGQGEGY